jgi:hypothetical protein
VYSDIGEDNIQMAFLWPITIWFILGYLIFYGIKKYAIALCEIIYQIKHKEDEDDNDN